MNNNDGDRRRSALHLLRRWCRAHDDHVNLEPGELGHERGESLVASLPGTRAPTACNPLSVPFFGLRPVAARYIQARQQARRQNELRRSTGRPLGRRTIAELPIESLPPALAERQSRYSLRSQPR